MTVTTANPGRRTASTALSSNAGGVCLFAVCRGKVAEGIDFSDNMARAGTNCIKIGLPGKRYSVA